MSKLPAVSLLAVKLFTLATSLALGVCVVERGSRPATTR